MKSKALFISTIIFFLLVNTRYFWDPWLDWAGMFLFGFLLIAYCLLALALLVQIIFSWSEKFKNKRRVALIFIMIFVLGSTLWKPMGVVDFESFESKDMLVAYSGKHTANCTQTIKLKIDKSYKIESICFGIHKETGTYTFKSDTVKFHVTRSYSSGGNEEYAFGVIKRSKDQNVNSFSTLGLYRTKNDSHFNFLTIIKDELK